MHRHRIGRDLLEQLAIGRVNVEPELSLNVGHAMVNDGHMLRVRGRNGSVDEFLRTVRVEITLDGLISFCVGRFRSVDRRRGHITLITKVQPYGGRVAQAPY